MKNLMKRVIGISAAAVLTFSVSTQALAATWYVEDGDIKITAEAGSQIVEQNGITLEDKAPVITNNDKTTAVDTTITLDGSKEVKVTLKDVNLETEGRSGVDVVGDTKATVTLEGKNKIESTNAAAIHVADGDLTITGDGEFRGRSHNDYEGSDVEAAVIGTNDVEDLNGSITITGDAYVDAYNYDADGSNDGAGIGTGEDGDLYGTIHITGNSKVKSASDYDGAGIGTGEDGNMKKGSKIIIDGNATIIKSYSDEEGAGIGTGEDGNMEDGSLILIGGNAKVNEARSEDDGAGIGTGETATIESGAQIIIEGNAFVNAIGEDEGCGIGSGRDYSMNGEIIIRDNAYVIALGGDCAAAIGADDKGDFNGIIRILDHARVKTGLEDSDGEENGDIGYIGSSSTSHHDNDEDGRFYIGGNVTINGIKGSDIEGLKDIINMQLDDDGNPLNLTIVQSDNSLPDDLTAIYVIDENGVLTTHDSVLKDGVLTITSTLNNASLVIPRTALTYLMNEGVEKITFVTNEKTSTIVLKDVYNAARNGMDILLKHEGKNASLIVSGQDVSDLIK